MLEAVLLELELADDELLEPALPELLEAELPDVELPDAESPTCCAGAITGTAVSAGMTRADARSPTSLVRMDAFLVKG
ncbi:MAG TPA: hypothetical protein VFK39_05460 [Gemmatimonadaceae bacterium]|nr:hypothetical protein [Gemmatimonadaceae bacterium]